jgi:hypothetical protein
VSGEVASGEDGMENSHIFVVVKVQGQNGLLTSARI